jgi:DNA-binding transcriptional regulator YhcF (GntR family)
MERFWIGDYFIDVQAKQLSIYAQMVFIALSRYANKDGETFVGVRKIAGVLGINKDTVSKSIQELVVSGLVGHCKTGKHRVSGLRLSSVRPEQFPVSDRVGPKEVFKEYIKEEKISEEDRKRAEAIKEKIRKERGWIR